MAEIILAIGTALTAVIGAAALLLPQLRALRKEMLQEREAREAHMLEITNNVAKIQVATNGMSEALLAATARASGAEGHRKGVEDERARNTEGSESI